MSERTYLLKKVFAATLICIAISIVMVVIFTPPSRIISERIITEQDYVSVYTNGTNYFGRFCWDYSVWDTVCYPSNRFNETYRDVNVTYLWQAKVVSVQIIKADGATYLNDTTYVGIDPIPPNSLSKVQLNGIFKLGQHIEIEFIDIRTYYQIWDIDDNVVEHSKQTNYKNAEIVGWRPIGD